MLVVAFHRPHYVHVLCLYNEEHYLKVKRKVVKNLCNDLTDNFLRVCVKTIRLKGMFERTEAENKICVYFSKCS